MTNSYCLKCRKQTQDINPQVTKTRNNRLMMKSKCVICGTTKTRFIKNPNGKGFDLHAMLPKRNLTLKGHNYTGPNNPLDKQLRYDKEGNILETYERPTGDTDMMSMRHDVDYAICNKKGKDVVKCKNAADKRYVSALDKIPEEDRQWGHSLARNLINIKGYLEV